MSVSPDTLLRLIRAGHLAHTPMPRVLGVDEWAWRKGRNYGTILCDLERGRVIDLLPDASSTAFADWLKKRSGIEIITRDRGGAYSEGAKHGAPQAVQIADRWHLLRNLGDAVERYFDRHRSLLKQATKASVVSSSSPTSGESGRPLVKEGDGPGGISRREQERLQRRARRKGRYDKALEMRQQGTAIRQIARTLGLSRKTVSKYLRAEGFPEMAPRTKRWSKLDPYLPYMRERWEAGCRNGYQLLREIRELGYEGSRSIVGERVTRWRKEGHPAGDTGGCQGAEAFRALSPRQARHLFVQQPDKLDDKGRQFLNLLFTELPETGVLYELAQRFGKLVRERHRESLDEWLEGAQESGIGEMAGFVRGIRRDLRAVEAALEYAWSNGLVEGHINRLKLIKRQMYGRAKFDLLRQRVLNAC